MEAPVEVGCGLDSFPHSCTQESKRNHIKPNQVTSNHDKNRFQREGGAQRRDILDRTDRVAGAGAAVGEREQPSRRLRGQDAPAAEGTPRRLQACEQSITQQYVVRTCARLQQQAQHRLLQTLP